MHRRKIFSTILSAGLLLIPSVCGQFPGKNTNGEGSGVELEATGTRESTPTQTSIPVAASISGSCNSPVQLIGLANSGAYIPITIEGLTYNFAISFEEEGTYVFSTKFCKNVLRLSGDDLQGCFYAGTATELGTDDEENTVNSSEGGFELEYVTLPSTASIGEGSNNVVFDNYPIRVVTDVDSDDKFTYQLLRSRFGPDDKGGIFGIIGLKSSGDFIKSLSSACGQSGWGIHLQPGSFFSFGGIDTRASAIGTNDTDSVVDFASSYVAEVQPMTTGFTSTPGTGFTKDVRLDPMAPYNIIPEDIRVAVEGEFTGGSSVDIKIAGVTFNVPWTSLVHSDSGTTSKDGTMILGTPFLQHIYAAVLPGGRQNVVFARDKGVGIAEFEPFSDIITNLPTQTQSTNIQATSTASSTNVPDKKVDSSTEDKPKASDIMAAKSSSNNIGAIVGGVVGGVVGLLIIFLAVCCFYRRRKLMRGNNRGVEKEYEAEFDAEIGHHDGFLPQFKESGYATLPTPPPPPGQQSRPQIPSLILGSPINLQYDSQTEYTPSLHPYHDESPSRSLSVTPLPPPSQTPILTIPPVPERRLSITPSLSIEPPSPLSRNVSAASRQNFPSITQLQRNRSNVRAVPEEDDYDVVSMASGPTYNPIMASQEASSSAPRLPFTHRPESDGAMRMTDRGAGL
ncbi:hypothetical protein TWF481_010673 [Arthrobotrys musiformis]|uniref:Peptidase A1 domain-containing protein n=1 Tax=Arthrobotrys musiformis TaxID=47236 RepID=A0AAV9W1F2_9PEZI